MGRYCKISLASKDKGEIVQWKSDIALMIDKKRLYLIIKQIVNL